MPRIRKKTSKRGTTHQRTKVRQKVAETHKKRKRDAKKNPQWKSKHKKDPGIPNSLPFKEDILAEIELTRRQAEEDKQRRKETKPQAVSTAPVAATPTITLDDPDTAPILIDSSLPTLGAVIESADAVLCVIDARDPQTFRSKRLEEIVAQKNKGLILVLTKTDLVPRENLVEWMSYLRSEMSAPVVAFRASDGFIPSTDKGKQKALLESVSKDVLLDAVAQVTKSHAAKETRIAVVGLTNSGKSTLLNSLLSAPSLPIYQPSLQQPKKATYTNTTLGAQFVSLSHAGREYQFIDTPGLGYVQFNAQPKGGHQKLSPEQVEESKAKDLLARNRGSFVHWKETDAAAAYVVSRAKHEDLILHYNLPAYNSGDVSAFLGGVARASGRLRKGGVPDLSDTARSIARDWSLGRLPYYAVPPVTSTTIASDPALDACMSLKEMRAPPRAWPVQLDSGAPDERDVALDAMFVVEVEERPARKQRMEVDDEESEDEESEEEDEDEEMGSVQDEDEDESQEEDESEDEPAPPPKPTSVLKSKRSAASARTPKKVSFATKQMSKAKPAPAPAPTPAPRRVGNAKSAGKKSQVVNVAGEEGYDFSKFF